MVTEYRSPRRTSPSAPLARGVNLSGVPKAVQSVGIVRGDDLVAFEFCNLV